MTKLPVVRASEVLKALQKAGFRIHHQTGSHARLMRSARRELKVTVPVHSGDVPKGTLKRILKQADLSIDEFLSLIGK